jgi:hypothetical protein
MLADFQGSRSNQHNQLISVVGLAQICWSSLSPALRGKKKRAGTAQ